MSYATNGTTRIWWEESGSGEPLLLAMGHAWAGRMWWPALPSLSARYRVICFDNRGVGRTEWDGSAFGIDDLAADAFAVLDAAGEDSAHVYGMSMGGLTAQEMALSHPERVRSLVLGCTGAFSADHPRGGRGDALRARISMPLVVRLYPGALYGPNADRDVIAQDVRLMRAASMPTAGRLAQSRATQAYRSLHRLGSITTPTLVVHGDRDKAVALDKGRELAAQIPGAELVVLPGAGHNYLADRGTAASDAVLGFLDRHRTGVDA
jgi:3-oxoadipate enol-lactonase